MHYNITDAGLNPAELARVLLIVLLEVWIICLLRFAGVCSTLPLVLIFYLGGGASHVQPMDLIVTILPVVTKDLPISPRFTPSDFLSRGKFSNLTSRQPMVEFYSLTFPRSPLRKKEHKSYFGKNRTHDFRTSRCAGYLLPTNIDHSGDECLYHTSIIQSVLLIVSHPRMRRDAYVLNKDYDHRGDY